MSLSEKIAAVVAAIGAELKLKADAADLATVATSGGYGDLSGLPTLGTAAETDASAYATAAQGVKADSAVQSGDSRLVNGPVSGRQGASSGAAPGIVVWLCTKDEYDAMPTHQPKFVYVATGVGGGVFVGDVKLDGVQPGDLAAVATSGSYGDLGDRPTLGTAAAWDAIAFATASQGATADSAVQPGDLAAVATSGQYSDLAGAPSIPDALTDLDTTVTGAQLNADHSKLAGIEAGAQKNVTPTWVALTGKPATFPPSSHTHPTAEVIGLDTALAGKQAVLGYTPQDVAAKGQANGYASLDGAGKVPITQLPASLMEYQGTWNAATNTPPLADGVGDIGDTYRITVGGSRDLGSGTITWPINGYAIYNGTVWEASGSAGESGVTTVNTRSGDVVLTAADVGLGNVNNTADSSKSVADAVALRSPINGQVVALKANLSATSWGSLDGSTGQTMYAGVTGTLPIANGGTGATTAADARAAIGAGTSNLTTGTTAGTACAGNDVRLSDARTPTAHTHTATDISDATTVGRSLVTAASQAAARTAIGAGTSSLTIGTTAATACAGNDARLSDTRTPTASSVTDSAVAANAGIALSKLAAGIVRGSKAGTVTTLDLWVGPQASVPTTRDPNTVYLWY
ncbi:hypothetical protein [[Mycobacterium] crassicus]|uniref:Minor tail protein n=1 Tax=[Mycobacterium] crassicus TaxID=2872309 RepID=A0ABU5XGA2_9MYCO|nr:hypothetical protein [Mycolicibacter sp. MYC098]MEB3021322.1 hypothetical protein [Mycolicibacter sp. MYC098]